VGAMTSGKGRERKRRGMRMRMRKGVEGVNAIPWHFEIKRFLKFVGKGVGQCGRSNQWEQIYC